MHYENICNKLVRGIVFIAKQFQIHISPVVSYCVCSHFFLKTKPIGKAKVKTLHYNFICDRSILMGKRELIALLNLSSWCLVMVERLFLAVPWGCLQFVIVVFPDHTHYFGQIVFTKTRGFLKPADDSSKLH